ncbi:hypothetical protein [Streptomyces sp. Act143]|uniref:hypothetical protein n=1 Tax=Streptomyces sp. Act143 TaxID=2200760 RepID=UPI0011B50913|nr:hypothetical protein [Streptomyces sp. Act143]
MADRTLYYQYADGSVSKRTVTDTGEPVPPPPGGTEITAEEYAQQLAAIEQTNADAEAELHDQEQQQSLEDYQALLALSVPEATARRLSGYTGPAEEV